jgi:hypothetical protein
MWNNAGNGSGQGVNPALAALKGVRAGGAGTDGSMMRQHTAPLHGGSVGAPPMASFLKMAMPPPTSTRGFGVSKAPSAGKGGFSPYGMNMPHIGGRS